MDRMKLLAKALQQLITEQEKKPRSKKSEVPASGRPGDRTYDRKAEPKDYKISELKGKTHKCPRCGEVGDIVTEHGLRTDRFGRRKFQSWCRTCRGKKEAHPSRHGLPRNYLSRK